MAVRTRWAGCAVVALVAAACGGEEAATKAAEEAKTAEHGDTPAKATTKGGKAAKPATKGQRVTGAKLLLFNPRRDAAKEDHYVKCAGRAVQEGFLPQALGAGADLRLARDATHLSVGVSGKSLQKATIAGVTAVAKGGRATVEVPLREALADVGTHWPTKSYDRAFPLEFELETTEGTKVGYLKCSRSAFYPLLRAVKQGPLLFAGEVADAAAPARSMVVESASGWHAAGPNVKLRHVDLIGFVGLDRAVVGKCDYINPQTRETKTIPKWKADLVGEVFDRRSGKRLARKTFKTGKVQCKPWIYKGETAVGAGADRDAADAWVKSFVKGGQVPSGWEVPARETAFRRLDAKYSVLARPPRVPRDARKGGGATGAVSPDGFAHLGKLKYGDGPEAVVKVLGEPQERKQGKVITSLRYGFELSASISTDKKMLSGLTVRHPEGTAKLQAAGVAPQLVALLGQSRDAVVAALGAPAEDRDGVLKWRMKRDGRKAGYVELECRPIWKGKCQVGTVRYFYP